MDWTKPETEDVTRVRGEIGPSSGRNSSLHLTVEFVDGTSFERYAHDPRCEWLVQHGWAMLHEALDLPASPVELFPPSDFEVPPEPEPEPEPEPTQPSTCRSNHGTDVSCPPTDRRIAGAFQVATTGTAGLFDNPTGGVRGRVGFDHEWLRMQFQGGGDFGGAARTSEGELAARLATWDVGLRTCGVPRWKRLELHVCLDVVGGALIITPPGGTNTPKPWGWSSITTGVAWKFGRFALFADIGPAIALMGNLTVGAAGERVIQTWTGFGRASVGTEVRF